MAPSYLYRCSSVLLCLVRPRIEGVCGVRYERTSRFMTRGHLGAHMLYGLETADQAAELFALASIIDSLFDHRLTCAKTVGGQDNTACIPQPGRCNSPIISQWFRFGPVKPQFPDAAGDRKSTRLNSSH